MPTLLGRLMARPTGDLTQLAGIWSVRLPGRSHAEDVATLYRAMTDTWALRDVLEDLSPSAARLLWELARDGGTPAAAPPPALNELVAKGFLHPAAEGQPVDGALPVLAEETGALCRRLAEERRQGDRARRPLAALVTTLDAGELAVAAECWGITYTPGGEPRAAIETALLDRLADPLALEDRLASLDRTDRRLYELVAGADQGLPLAEVRRRAALPLSALRRALRHLHAYLLVWESWVERERRLFVPAELRTRLQRSSAPLRPVPAEATAWRHPLALAWDLLAYLRLACSPTSTDGARPDQPVLPLGYPFWHAPSAAARPDYLSFLRAAQTALGLTDPAACERWAAQALLAQQAALYERWRTSQQAWVAEPAEAPLGATSRASLRSAVLDGLSQLEPGAWYPVETLAARLAGSRAAVGRRGSAASPGQRTISRRPRLLSAETRAVALLLQTALVWLGVLEEGREQAQRRPAVRLTSLGAWLLGQGPSPDVAEGALVVEPSLRLLVYEVNAALLWQLLAFATPERLDRVSLFRLSRASVAAGLAAGLTGPAMVETLTRAARYEVPQNVVYSVRDWARATRHARLERALLLTFDDDLARDQALNLPPLRGLGASALPGARLRLPIADDAAEQRARAALHALGFSSEQ